MEKQHKDAVWVPHAEIEPEVCGKGESAAFWPTARMLCVWKYL